MTEANAIFVVPSFGANPGAKFVTDILISPKQGEWLPAQPWRMVDARS